jgi:hypothetical protein
MNKLTVSELKDIIRKYNKENSSNSIKGWSKLKKNELIELINKKIETKKNDAKKKETKKKEIKKTEIKKNDDDEEKTTATETRKEWRQALEKALKMDIRHVDYLNMLKNSTTEKWKLEYINAKIKEYENKKKKDEKLSIKITPPKMGDKGFDPDFSKKTKIEQLEIVLNNSEITGEPQNKEFYESKADEFYNEANKLMNMSPYKAVREFVNKYQLTPDILELIYQSKTDGDFFPTGKSCIDNMINEMNWWLKLDDGEFKMLEGTSGIGQVGYYFKQRYPNSNITLNELSLNNLAVSKLFLNNDDYTFSNKNFFDITKTDYDLIFLNPPFGSKNHFYLKFLLHALYLLNQTKGNKMIFFISPPLGWDKKITGAKGTTILTSDFTSIIDFISPNRESDKPRIPPKALIKWINELNNSDYTTKDLEKVKNERNEGDANLNDRQQKLYDLIENDYYYFSMGQGIGECTDFGGTKFNANMYYFQVMRN